MPKYLASYGGIRKVRIHNDPYISRPNSKICSIDDSRIFIAEDDLKARNVSEEYLKEISENSLTLEVRLESLLEIRAVSV